MFWGSRVHGHFDQIILNLGSSYNTFQNSTAWNQNPFLAKAFCAQALLSVIFHANPHAKSNLDF